MCVTGILCQVRQPAHYWPYHPASANYKFSTCTKYALLSDTGLFLRNITTEEECIITKTIGSAKTAYTFNKYIDECNQKEVWSWTAVSKIATDGLFHWCFGICDKVWLLTAVGNISDMFSSRIGAVMKYDYWKLLVKYPWQHVLMKNGRCKEILLLLAAERVRADDTFYWKIGDVKKYYSWQQLIR